MENHLGINRSVRKVLNLSSENLKLNISVTKLSDISLLGLFCSCTCTTKMVWHRHKYSSWLPWCWTLALWVAMHRKMLVPVTAVQEEEGKMCKHSCILAKENRHKIQKVCSKFRLSFILSLLEKNSSSNAGEMCILWCYRKDLDNPWVQHSLETLF